MAAPVGIRLAARLQSTQQGIQFRQNLVLLIIDNLYLSWLLRQDSCVLQKEIVYQGHNLNIQTAQLVH